MKLGRLAIKIKLMGLGIFVNWLQRSKKDILFVIMMIVQEERHPAPAPAPAPGPSSP